MPQKTEQVRTFRPTSPQKVESMPVLPSKSIQNGDAVSKWTKEDWETWVTGAYDSLAVYPHEHISTYNVRARKNAAVLLEQFYEGMMLFKDVIAPELSAKKRHKIPKLYIATRESMYDAGINADRFTWNFLADGQIYVNIYAVLDTAGKRDLHTMQDQAAFVNRNVPVTLHKAGITGRFLFDGVENMASNFFVSEYGNDALRNYKRLDDCLSLEEYDSQPMVMFSLLADIAAATYFLNGLHQERRGRSSDVSDVTVRHIVTRVENAWKLLPQKWQKELSAFKEKTEAEYFASYATRMGQAA